MAAEDFEAIRNVLALYCHVIDSKEWGRIGDVYATDGCYSHRGKAPHEGPEAIAEYLATVTDPVVHTSTDHHIELGADGNTGIGRGKFLIVFPDASVAAGHYDDVYSKTAAGWRIKSRTSWVQVPRRQD